MSRLRFASTRLGSVFSLVPPVAIQSAVAVRVKWGEQTESGLKKIFRAYLHTKNLEHRVVGGGVWCNRNREIL